MKTGNGSPPDETVIQFPDLGKLRRYRPGIPLGWIALALLAVMIAFGSVFTIDPEEIGVVLRFGRFVRTAEPGLNLKLPLGIEAVYKVPVERQLKEEFGFRTVRAGVRTQYSEKSFEDESLMLTGDLNIADVEWVVQYRIVDPYKFLFRVRGVQETFRAMTEAVMREVVGDRTVNEVITVGRQEMASLVEQKLQELCDQYESGLKVEQVVLQDVNPPDPVKPSFNEVNQAQQEKEEKINASQSEYNRQVPKARGEAQQTIQQAEGYELDRVNRAEGEAARFDSIYTEYRKAPEVTRKRIYLETMNQILPRAGRKVVVDQDVRGVLPLLNLEGGARPGGQTGGQR
jgi:membrane protease subunit HflK